MNGCFSDAEHPAFSRPFGPSDGAPARVEEVWSWRRGIDRAVAARAASQSAVIVESLHFGAGSEGTRACPDRSPERQPSSSVSASVIPIDAEKLRRGLLRVLAPGLVASLIASVTAVDDDEPRTKTKPSPEAIKREHERQERRARQRGRRDA